MKVMRCSEIGMKCDFVARGKSEQEVMKKALEHGRKEHEIKPLDFGLERRVREAIHEE